MYSSLVGVWYSLICLIGVVTKVLVCSAIFVGHVDVSGPYPGLAVTDMLVWIAEIFRCSTEFIVPFLSLQVTALVAIVVSGTFCVSF